MGILRVMSKRGDNHIIWDTQKQLEGDPGAIAAVQEAERIFAREQARGATAYRLDPEKPAQRIDQFESTAQQIVMVPHVTGG